MKYVNRTQEVIFEAIKKVTNKFNPETVTALWQSNGCLWFGCGHFIPDSEVENLETVSETTTQTEVVFRDSDYYRDDDRIADVTRLITYYLCPLCGFKQRKTSEIIRQVNERPIRE